MIQEISLRSKAKAFESSAEVLGNQSPHYATFTAEGDDLHGYRAAQFYSKINYALLPWQIDEIFKYLRTNEDGKWTHRTCGLLVPRQNGKTESVFAAVLYQLFVLNSRIYFTTQSWKAAERHWEDRLKQIVQLPAIKPLIDRAGCSQGKAYVQTKAGGMLIVTTRNAGADRGVSKIDTLVYDEAYDISSGEEAGMKAIQKTAQNPQTYFLSSPVKAEVHPHGMILSGLRERAYTKPSPTLTFSEWMAPEEMDRGEEDTWLYCNPSAGDILPLENIKEDYESLSTPEAIADFDVETLGRGQWYNLGGLSHKAILDMGKWERLASQGTQRSGDCAIALDVSPGGDTAALVSATRVPSGTYLSLAKIDAFDRTQLLRLIKSAVEKNDPVSVMLDPIGPAASMISLLEDEGIEVDKASASIASSALELFLQDVEEEKIAHDGSQRLTDAIRSATFRKIRQSGRALTSGSNGDITPAVASTLALYALSEHEIKTPVQSQYFTKATSTRSPKTIRDTKRKQLVF